MKHAERVINFADPSPELGNASVGNDFFSIRSPLGRFLYINRDSEQEYDRFATNCR